MNAKKKYYKPEITDFSLPSGKAFTEPSSICFAGSVAGLICYAGSDIVVWDPCNSGSSPRVPLCNTGAGVSITGCSTGLSPN